MRQRRGDGIHFVAVLALAVTVWLGGAQSAHAQWSGNPFGLGLQAGDPSPLTLKYWFAKRDAFQVAFGWHGRYQHYYYEDGAAVAVDWAHQFAAFGPRSGVIWFGAHMGLGAGVDFQANTAHCYRDARNRLYCPSSTSESLVIRIPIGLDLYLSPITLELYAEVVPGVLWFGPHAFILPVNLGVRYYF